MENGQVAQLIWSVAARTQQRLELSVGARAAVLRTYYARALGCVYMYMHVCKYVYTYVRIYVYTYIRICLYTYTYTDAYTYLYIHM